MASTGAPCALHACRSVLAVLNLVRIADRFRLLLLLGALPPAARGGLLAYAKPGVAAAAGMQGKLHRVGPIFGSTLTVSNRDSQSNGWVSWKIMGRPCGFQALVAVDGRTATSGGAPGNLRCQLLMGPLALHRDRQRAAGVGARGGAAMTAASL